MRRRGLGPSRMAARSAVRRMARRHRRRRRRRILLVGGMVALGTASVYKLSKQDTERVEKYTGKPAEELTDEELSQAMDNLGIPKEELSDAEFEEVEKADAEGDPEGDPKGGSGDYLDQLERLAELNKQGILTDEEFAAKKKQLLGL
jgi:hypothetical protein